MSLSLILQVAGVVAAIVLGAAIRRKIITAERAVDAARLYAESIVATVREPLVILDGG